MRIIDRDDRLNQFMANSLNMVTSLSYAFNYHGNQQNIIIEAIDDIRIVDSLYLSVFQETLFNHLSEVIYNDAEIGRKIIVQMKGREIDYYVAYMVALMANRTPIELILVMDDVFMQQFHTRTGKENDILEMIKSIATETLILSKIEFDTILNHFPNSKVEGFALDTISEDDVVTFSKFYNKWQVQSTIEVLSIRSKLAFERFTELKGVTL